MDNAVAAERPARPVCARSPPPRAESRRQAGRSMERDSLRVRFFRPFYPAPGPGFRMCAERERERERDLRARLQIRARELRYALYARFFQDKVPRMRAHIKAFLCSLFLLLGPAVSWPYFSRVYRCKRMRGGFMRGIGNPMRHSITAL